MTVTYESLSINLTHLDVIDRVKGTELDEVPFVLCAKSAWRTYGTEKQLTNDTGKS